MWTVRGPLGVNKVRKDFFRTGHASLGTQKPAKNAVRTSQGGIDRA